ncbi:S-adenosyl-L-methionine-dependent methyltransferase [Conidiobolus coronatus NRRL 28638]|uniref:S-adenosyl-L-methionine-dependent methyltransferase n=1 Tax=Conidiobolus coronatus (strain ATCC 28846 / CBS 209.66 / NRRL 28638) TaxID=796925 RepID=A0A137NZS9_CONC2|nr:S-adenosyl-L-methionine-dependent methyltransferase [Conidiobolus coronatus NRRL 28638]|eukprot:KXN68340.1 S-adenosyl-L-methionine-dependent methyltransferase [Conidiobolus coronatus NRRL 28638]
MIIKRLFHCRAQVNSKLNKLISQLEQKYYKGNLESAKQEIKWLNEYIEINKERGKTEKLEDLISRRVEQNEPLQYILGDQPFGPLNILVKQPILIPRWETEAWTHEFANFLNQHLSKSPKNLKILEIGVGTGCISLLLSHLIIKGRANILGIDINPAAIELSLKNKSIHAKNYINNKVEFIQGDIFSDDFIKELVEKFGEIDLIVSNPPYIPPTQYSDLTPDVKQWEDKNALTTRDSLGLEFYSRMLDLTKVKGLFNINSKLPKLVVEYGGNYQTEDLIKLVKSKGGEIEIKKDLVGNDRVGYITI